MMLTAMMMMMTGIKIKRMMMQMKCNEIMTIIIMTVTISIIMTECRKGKRRKRWEEEHKKPEVNEINLF